MQVIALSTNYKYHQDLLEYFHNNGIHTAFATSHKPELERTKCEFYIKHSTPLIDGKPFYVIDKLQKIIATDAPPLTKEIIDYFESVERDFYTLTDRYSYFARPFRYRKRLFRHGIRFWLDFYAKNKIDALFSPCSPHNLPDYTAFHVAKYLGIPTIFTGDVMINDHVLVMDDYRVGFKVPDGFMAGKSDEEIKASINPKFAEKAFKHSNEILGSQMLNDTNLKLKNMNVAVTKAPKSLTSKSFTTRAKKFVSPEIFKPKFKAAFAMNGLLTDFQRRFIRVQCGQRLKKIKSDYESLAVYPDYEKKYVYFAMHLNPERTTHPESGVFEDHLMAIEVLSRSVPEGWVIYVKENPSQYGKKLNLVNGKHFRDGTDYADYVRLPNVKLIRQDVKTKDLIENAAVVSSLKGTVGWESICAGKACIVFANSWYSACRSALQVYDVPSCKAAIETILTRPAAEVETDRLKFFAYMQQHIVIGSMGGHFNLEFATESYENQVKSLGAVIISRLRP